MRFNNLVACGRNTLICIKHTPSGGESANNAEMDATQILDAYIKLHTDYSGYVVDTSWLPADKAKMKQVLQQYWLQTTSAQIRKWLQDGWVFLAWFQDGVGPIPIDISSKVRSNVPAKQLGQYKKIQNQWLELVMAEWGVLQQEVDRFKQANAATN
jgi:NDP-sugar pyrophosphorylase family protein